MVGIIEEITIYKDLGIGAVSMIIFYTFARYTSEKAFKEVEDANKRSQESQQKFLYFIETSYKENIKTMSELVNVFKDHIKTKERALDLLEENQKKLEDKYEILRKYHE